MTVVSLKTGEFGSDGAVKVEFSDGTSLLFTPEYLPEGQFPEKDPVLLKIDHELSAPEEEAFRFAAVCYQAERIALKLVARAEQNSQGLISKLERRRYDAVVAKTVVSHLLSRNLLDDGRYAELWIHSRLTAGNAPTPRWLLASLEKRRIDRTFSRKALMNVLDPETEYALLLRYLERKVVSEDKKPRLLRAQLKYEGFSFDVLQRYFND